ncbi:ABC transporter permease [Paenibacillus qinlingensis]|uniref:ABC-2 type transport system permease protein n=1 Tax=Paenibacillus qinlingensis TaxID=1837343 RepID=A0ABU1NVP8_9BACL|nr:ABC transporter permease [Paenibacillus qinlingensis]MDR6551547.1 ABC-2 type transport system permease protein [Paenibacillus qinlingensis]
MTSSYQVFARRVRSDLRFQYRAIRMAVDWVIAIYFVIPLLIVAGYHYYAWYMTPPTWLSGISIHTVATLFYIYTWMGTLRYFVEEGDQLFLRQNEGWFRHIMHLGYRYSVVLQAITMMLATLLFLPLLVPVYAYTITQVVCFWLLAYVVKLNIGLIRQLLALRFQRFMLWLLRIVAFACGFILFQVLLTKINDQTFISWAAIGLGILTFVLLTKTRLREKGAFFADVARERDARMRIVSLMLIRVTERKRKPTRRYPLFFSRSQRLLKGKGAGNGIAELLVKSYFRNGLQWRQSIQFVVVISGALFILPGAIKILVWILAVVLLVFWRKSFCKDELTTPFLSLFPIRDTMKHQAIQTAIPILVLPAMIVISLVAGISLFTWWGPIVMIGAAIPLTYGTSSVFTSWY